MALVVASYGLVRRQISMINVCDTVVHKLCVGVATFFPSERERGGGGFCSVKHSIPRLGAGLINEGGPNP